MKEKSAFFHEKFTESACFHGNGPFSPIFLALFRDFSMFFRRRAPNVDFSEKPFCLFFPAFSAFAASVRRESCPAFQFSSPFVSVWLKAGPSFAASFVWPASFSAWLTDHLWRIVPAVLPVVWLPVFLCLAFSLQCKAFLFRSGQDRLTHLARTPLFRIRQGPAWRFVRKQNPVISHNPIKKQDICRQKENLSEKRSDFELFGLMRLRKLTSL